MSEHLIYDDQHLIPAFNNNTNGTTSEGINDSTSTNNKNSDDDITVSGMFELFASKDMLPLFIKILTHRDIAMTIKIQVIQSLSILIQNITHHTSLYFILSNNHINVLITTVPRYLREQQQHQQQHAHNNNDRHQPYASPASQQHHHHNTDELIAYYVSLLKTLSLRLNHRTLQFFFQPQTQPPTFPLLTEALPYHSHDEQMVFNASRTLTLHVLQLAKQQIEQQQSHTLYDYLQRYILNDYFHDVINSINAMTDKLYDVTRQPGTATSPSKATPIYTHHIEDILDKMVDTYYYIQDIFDVRLDSVNTLLSDVLFQQHAMKLINNTRNTASSSTTDVSLYIMSQLLSTIGYKSLVDQCNDALLSPSTAPGVVHLIHNDNTLTVHNTLLLLQSVLHNPSTDRAQVDRLCSLPRHDSQLSNHAFDVQMESNNNNNTVHVAITATAPTHDDTSAVTLATQMLQLLHDKRNLPISTIDVICTLVSQVLQRHNGVSAMNKKHLTLVNDVYKSSTQRLFACCRNSNVTDVFALLEHEYLVFTKHHRQTSNNNRPTAVTLVPSLFHKQSVNTDAVKYSSILIHSACQRFFRIRSLKSQLECKVDLLLPKLFHEEATSTSNAVIDVQQHRQQHAVLCALVTNVNKAAADMYLLINQRQILLLTPQSNDSSNFLVVMRVDTHHILYAFADDNVLLLMIQHPSPPHPSALRAAKQSVGMSSSSSRTSHESIDLLTGATADDDGVTGADVIDIPVWQMRLKIKSSNDTVNAALYIMSMSSQRKINIYSAVYNELKSCMLLNVADTIEDALKSLQQQSDGVVPAELPLLADLLSHPRGADSKSADPQFVPQLF